MGFQIFQALLIHLQMSLSGSLLYLPHFCFIITFIVKDCGCDLFSFNLLGVTNIGHWYDCVTCFYFFSFFRLQGNPLCSNSSLLQFCRFESDENNSQSSTNTTSICPTQECPPPFEYLSSPASPVACFCAAPLFVGYRLKSPGFSDFRPYINAFEELLSSSLDLFLYQLYIDSFFWEEGPRLGMNLKIFPLYGNSSTTKFNMSEVDRIFRLFTLWKMDSSDIFGPYELISFPL